MNNLLTTLTVAAATLFRGTPTTKPKICYDEIGCFSNASPWTSSTRRIPLPQNPLNVTTDIIFYNDKTSNASFTIYPNISKEIDKVFEPRHPTFIISHGWGVNGYSFSHLADTILSVKKNANVFLVNWGKSAELLDYNQAMADIRVAAAVIKRLVDRLVSLGARLEDFHLIGHSIGAHLMAYVGKKFKGKLGRLTGLDPAGPGFSSRNRDEAKSTKAKKIRMSPRDALFTEALHTSLIISGIMEPVADIDYYFNSVLTQPGCILEPPKRISAPNIPFVDPVVCSHSFSTVFYEEALKNPNCFKGRPITVKDFFLAILNTFTLTNGRDLGARKCGNECVPLNLDAVKSPFRGSVVVKTKKDPPYCLNH